MNTTEPGSGRAPEPHQLLRESLGAYVLGQLSPQETSDVANHLAGCADCRAELDDLTPVAAALGTARPALDGAFGPQPPAGLGDRVLDTIREQRDDLARRRRRGRALFGLAAAAVAVVAFGVGLQLGPGPDGPPVREIATSVSPGVTAQAGLVKHTWGTELKLDATGFTQGQTYTVTFVRDDGERVAAGGIIGTGANHIVCSVNAAVPIEQADELLITGPTGRTVVSADLG